jgi:serine/threonine protein kinase
MKCLASDKLEAYGGGRLPFEEVAALEAHLAECAHCRTELEALSTDSLVNLLRATQPHLGSRVPGEDWGPPPVPSALVEHPRYRLIECLGQGGMGQVWKAEHRLMQRTVALKVIRHQLTANPAAVERFQREMQLVAKLDHPNVVRAYDAEQAGATHFLVMEYIEGATLARMVETEGRLPVGAACEHVRQAACGLQHAHERGLIHRDIKPGNILIDRRGVAKVLDFGLAAFASPDAVDGGLTAFGQAMGTPDYLAPEQARDARSVDIRADIYALGCTLYYLLAGHPPFPEGNVHERIAAHLERAPQPLAEIRSDVPPEVVRVMQRMIEKDPARRYQTPAEVAEALSPFADASRAAMPAVRSRRWIFGAAAGVILAAAGVVALSLAGRGQPPLDTAGGDRPIQAAPTIAPQTPVNEPASTPKRKDDVRLIHPRAYFHYDAHFKGLFVDVDDDGTGKEALLIFPQQTVARGRLQPVPAAGPNKGMVSRVIFELVAGGSKIAFEPRKANDIRSFKHCGSLKGVKPGPISFVLEYIDEDGDRHLAPKAFERIVPAFQAEIVDRELRILDVRGPFLRVYPYALMKDCFLAVRKDGPWLPLPRHESVPMLHEIEIDKVPDLVGRAKSPPPLWIKGTADSGEVAGPERVAVQSPK